MVQAEVQPVGLYKLPVAALIDPVAPEPSTTFVAAERRLGAIRVRQDPVAQPSFTCHGIIVSMPSWLEPPAGDPPSTPAEGPRSS
jgi:hypothetical protein